MKIYNTKSLQLEEFRPIEEGKVMMYVCGPTVYNDVHIGNVRPVVVFDTLRRVFEAEGYKVYYVSNYTDVDDKIIREAKKRGISEKELTDEMIAAYNEIRHALHAAGVCPDRLDSIRDDIQALSQYYEGSLWREDFETDEAGLLPPDLKRGVLSEDGVYNLLSEYDTLRKQDT